jgi:hypothetical protein
MDESNLILLTNLLRCRNCNGSTKYCCVGSALRNALPSNFPIDICSIAESYLLNAATRSFLTRSPPTEATIRCYIRKHNQKFELYMEMNDNATFQQTRRFLTEQSEEARMKLLHSIMDEKNAIETTIDEKANENNLKPLLFENAEKLIQRNEDIFLLAAVRTRTWKGNEYTICSQKVIGVETDLTIQDPAILGRLKSNFGGTEFLMCDIVEQTTTLRNKTKTTRSVRDSGIIRFSHFFVASGSPIQIQVYLGNVNQIPIIVEEKKQEENKEIEEVRKRQFEAKVNANNVSQGKIYSARIETCEQPIECYENLRPVWHDAINAYVLHFDNHRIREKSIKNFKLIRTNDSECRAVLQLGRVPDRNVFVMDYAYPVTTLQAFQIALAAIDPKLGV